MIEENPTGIAESLFKEFIQTKHCRLPECVPEEPAVVAKIRLYQFASLMLAILNEEQTKPSYALVRGHLERLFGFSLSPDEKGVKLLTDVRYAMSDLSDLLILISRENPAPFTWSLRWLASIGVDENNPAKLVLFSLNWIEYYKAVVDSLREITPVA